MCVGRFSDRPRLRDVEDLRANSLRSAFGRFRGIDRADKMFRVCAIWTLAPRFSDRIEFDSLSNACTAVDSALLQSAVASVFLIDPVCMVFFFADLRVSRKAEAALTWRPARCNFAMSTFCVGVVILAEEKVFIYACVVCRHPRIACRRPYWGSSSSLRTLRMATITLNSNRRTVFAICRRSSLSLLRGDSLSLRLGIICAEIR